MARSQRPGKDVIGAYGERVAGRHLTQDGMEIIQTNWRCRHGEIDIIARDGPRLVFCEVKARTGTGFGEPAEAVRGAKERRLRRLAAQWLSDSGHRAREIRFDVVSVLVDAGGAGRIQHLRGAF